MKSKGEAGEISSLYDGYDMPQVTYEGFGDESYRLDKIIYMPVLDTGPVSAGLLGWKGNADELAP